MKAARISKVVLLVLILIPLSGCIGDDDAPVSTGGEDSEISDGIPPAKFTFESLKLEPSGTLTRAVKVTPGQTIPHVGIQIGDDRITWAMKWSISGLEPLGTGSQNDEIGEAWYSIWLGRVDESKDEGVIWELLHNNNTVAEDGTIEGGTPKYEKKYGEDYAGFLLTIETDHDSDPEIRLLEVLDIEPADPESKEDTTWGMEELKPFSGTFADAKVQELEDGKINLTVTALALPRTEGAYDLFLRNQQDSHYLGTLKFDAAAGGHTFSTQPDPKLFTRYQFFISLEHLEEKKDDADGFRVMTSKFSK